MKLEQLLMAMDSDLFNRLIVRRQTDLNDITGFPYEVIFSSGMERKVLKDYLGDYVQYFDVDDCGNLNVVIKGIKLV